MASEGPAFVSTPRARAVRSAVFAACLVGLVYAIVVILGLLGDGDRESLGLPGRHPAEDGEVTELGPVSVEAEKKALESETSGSASPSPSAASPSAVATGSPTAPAEGAAPEPSEPADEGADQPPADTDPPAPSAEPSSSRPPADDGALLDADVDVLGLVGLGVSV